MTDAPAARTQELELNLRIAQAKAREMEKKHKVVCGMGVVIFVLSIVLVAVLVYEFRPSSSTKDGNPTIDSNSKGEQKLGAAGGAVAKNAAPMCMTGTDGRYFPVGSVPL